MLKTQDETFTKEGVGVAVMRLQVFSLDGEPQTQIDSMLERHDQVIIVLCLSPVKGSAENPLDFTTRRKMIESKYPNITVLYNKDCPSDEVWSKKLDEMVRDNVSPGSKIVAYGSRDGFINKYNGGFGTKEFLPSSYQSSKSQRKAIMNSSSNSEEFRRGCIVNAGSKYPTAYMAVDVAVFDDEYEHVLLARKPNETKFRFIGGFVDPSNNHGTAGALEANARREVMEEANIDITDPEYVASSFIDDWRYRNEQDKIMSTLFASKYMCGKIDARDDICELQWYPISALSDACHNQDLRIAVVDEHLPMVEMLIGWLFKKLK
jgi:bifunctional NMN adenylyltransferase/nudix hydrolase